MITGGDALLSAMRLLVQRDATQYLLANLRKRSDGALKAHKHAELTKAYVAVMRGIDPDVVRRHHEAEYAAVHDATADELTSRLDEAIGFDLDGHVDDDLTEQFVRAFHKIAMRCLFTHPAEGAAEDDETYEIGKRDGYEKAVQDIDLRTGGDGEYRYCTDHDLERVLASNPRRQEYWAQLGCRLARTEAAEQRVAALEGALTLAQGRLELLLLAELPESDHPSATKWVLRQIYALLRPAAETGEPT